MERECHKLDLELAQHTKGKAGERDSFQKFSTSIHKLTEMQEEKERVQHYCHTLDSAVTSIALQLSDCENSLLLLELQKEALHARQQLEHLVTA